LGGEFAPLIRKIGIIDNYSSKPNSSLKYILQRQMVSAPEVVQPRLADFLRSRSELGTASETYASTRSSCTYASTSFDCSDFYSSGDYASGESSKNGRLTVGDFDRIPNGDLKVG